MISPLNPYHIVMIFPLLSTIFDGIMFMIFPLWSTMFMIFPLLFRWWFQTMQFYFPCHICDVILPTDELIFFRGVGIPPTRTRRECFREKYGNDLGIYPKRWNISRNLAWIYHECMGNNGNHLGFFGVSVAFIETHEFT